MSVHGYKDIVGERGKEGEREKESRKGSGREKEKDCLLYTIPSDPKVSRGRKKTADIRQSP